jgi:alpha-galactosidase
MMNECRVLATITLRLTCVLWFTSAAQGGAQPGGPGHRWRDEVLAIPYHRPELKEQVRLELIRQDYEQLEANRSIMRSPLVIAGRSFDRGLGTHSVSHIRVHSTVPIERFSAWIGINDTSITKEVGSVVFSVSSGEREFFHSEVLRNEDKAQRVELDLGGVRILDLHVGNAGDGPACDHANWAEAAVTLQGGRLVFLDTLEIVTDSGSRYPFSFRYGDDSSNDILARWPTENRTQELDADRKRTTTHWTDPATGLRVTYEVTSFAEFPALEWVLYFENTGNADTSIIENVQALNLTFDAPLSERGPYRVHATNGGPSSPADFEPQPIIVVDQRHAARLTAGTGRSSTRNLPFFKIDTGRGSAVVAVGWSGMWQASATSANNQILHVTAGMEKTHFLLHPGEKVRSPRMLVLFWEGDSVEANAQFRRLIYRHFAAKRNGKTPLPTLFCNTCFTRNGLWLNECNAENQISLIKAYAPLGLEALLTDAGWFEGEWPAGAGNWTPRKDAYPDGMAPVAAAAKQRDMIYGLWFEPERVVAGTTFHREHPEWVLASNDNPQRTYLANFGLPEVQEYYFNIVKGFMRLPGFRVYRQDFNMDPLPYWRYGEAPDRQGITEMKYIEGLYAYWDRIASAWPDSLREECASGGNRIDLETVWRMHLHQKTDYWFDNEADQAQLWGLSQYLPNNVVVAHLNRLDEYSFHSTLASSLCLGWIADAPDFDVALGERLLNRYREIRHLLIDAWYPLLPYSRDRHEWTGVQFHRSDLNEGLLLIFRHGKSAYLTAEVALRGLDPEVRYDLVSDHPGQLGTFKGSELMARHQVSLPRKPESDLIVYRPSSD